MKKILLFFVCIITTTIFADICNDNCRTICNNNINCKLNCISDVCNNATTINNFLPEKDSLNLFTFKNVLNLHGNGDSSSSSSVIITGSDSPSKPKTSNIYFTTLEGTVYRYDEERNVLNAIYIINKEDLYYNFELNIGLYDIAFDRDYNINGKVYLYYASVSNNDNVEYYDIIEEHHASGFYLENVRKIKRIPQYELNSKCSGNGWMKMGLREKIITGPAWLAFFTGCENLTTTVNVSAIYEIIPDEIQDNHYHHQSIMQMNISQPYERLFSSVSQKIISCDMSIFKSMCIYCIVEDIQGVRYLSKIKVGSHYNAKNSHDDDDDNMELYLKDLKYNEEVLVEFDKDDCPVSSLQIYSGRTLSKYKTHIFMSKSACYNNSTGIFQPAQFLKLYRNHRIGIFQAINLPYSASDKYIINTRIVGADKHNDVYFAGVSIKDNSVVLYKITQ